MDVEDLNWRSWLTHGDQYLNAAAPKSKSKPNKFGNSIVYNLLSMSLEGYIMAILDYHKMLPDNHTYTDLLDALEGVLPLDKNLKSRILQLENIQSICSVEKYHRTDPTTDELSDLREAIHEISQMAHDTCSAKA